MFVEATLAECPDEMPIPAWIAGRERERYTAFLAASGLANTAVARTKYLLSVSRSLQHLTLARRP